MPAPLRVSRLLRANHIQVKGNCGVAAATIRIPFMIKKCAYWPFCAKIVQKVLIFYLCTRALSCHRRVNAAFMPPKRLSMGVCR
jgi:hypothetical protein